MLLVLAASVSIRLVYYHKVRAGAELRCTRGDSQLEPEYVRVRRGNSATLVSDPFNLV